MMGSTRITSKAKSRHCFVIENTFCILYKADEVCFVLAHHVQGTRRKYHIDS